MPRPHTRENSPTRVLVHPIQSRKPDALQGKRIRHPRFQGCGHGPITRLVSCGVTLTSAGRAAGLDGPFAIGGGAQGGLGGHHDLFAFYRDFNGWDAAPLYGARISRGSVTVTARTLPEGLPLVLDYVWRSCAATSVPLAPLARLVRLSRIARRLRLYLLESDEGIPCGSRARACPADGRSAKAVAGGGRQAADRRPADWSTPASATVTTMPGWGGKIEAHSGRRCLGARIRYTPEGRHLDRRRHRRRCRFTRAVTRVSFSRGCPCRASRSGDQRRHLCDFDYAARTRSPADEACELSCWC